jgi:hypothetical protein
VCGVAGVDVAAQLPVDELPDGTRVGVQGIGGGAQRGVCGVTA